MLNKKFEAKLESEDRLSCRFLVFTLTDDLEVVLDYDGDYERPSTRHKYRVVCKWSRLDGRDNTLDKRPVPRAAVDEAIEEFQQLIFCREEVADGVS